jgi:hypothetical protein
MKSRWSTLGLFLIVSALVLGGCRQSTPEPTELPSPIPPEVTREPTATVAEGGIEASEQVLAARDQALAYLSTDYGEEAPASGLTWAEKRMTPEGLLGAETFQYAAQDWIVTISYPVVAPDQVVYRVVVSNSATAFEWQGEVDATGNVKEVGAEVSDPVLTARDLALAYLIANYGEQAAPSDPTWTRRRTTPEGLVGAETYQYRAGYWVITISYPMAAPDAVVYRVVVSNENTGFQWQGEVNAAGEVTEALAPISGRPVVGWYGQVVSLPEGAQFDDYLSLEPQGTGEVGLTGADATATAEIEGLRDSGTYAHFWGTLVCGVPDYNACQLVVTHLRPDKPGPFFEPDPVEAWDGTILSTPEAAQYDDYFVLAGAFPLRYGIDSSDPALAAQLESLRDTDTTVRVWGRLTCGVMDVNGSQISVIALAVVGDSPVPVATLVDGWVGTVIPLEPGAQHDDYFEREDGQRFGIDSTDEDMQKRIQAFRTVGARVRVWGQLLSDVLDVEGRQIQLERYELESRSETVDGWVGTIIKLDPGAQHDDYFERDDGQRYGIETPDPKLAVRLETLREAGARVQVWGELLSEVLDVESRQIRVTEIEVLE